MQYIVTNPYLFLWHLLYRSCCFVPLFEILMGNSCDINKHVKTLESLSLLSYVLLVSVR